MKPSNLAEDTAVNDESFFSYKSTEYEEICIPVVGAEQIGPAIDRLAQGLGSRPEPHAMFSIPMPERFIVEASGPHMIASKMKFTIRCVLKKGEITLL